MVVTDGVVPDVEPPVALVGIAEKGYTTLEIVAESAGGHSSMPPDTTAVGLVAGAVSRLEEHKLPARMTEPTRRLFDAVGPHMPLDRRLVFANLWLFEPIVMRILASKPKTDATIRTTTAPTMLEGSSQENVLAQRARAVINFRILPGSSSRQTLERVTEIVDDDRVEVRLLGENFFSEPSPVSSTDTAAWRALTAAIAETFPDAVVAPTLTLATTDSRAFNDYSDDIYRFLPVRLTDEDIDRIHGTDERIGVEAYRRMIQFYVRAIRHLHEAR
jgi:carboxypeptidase PM20D1